MDAASIGLKVLEILSPFLLAALTWVAAKLAQLIRAKVDNEYLKGVLVRLDDAEFTAVKDVQQTVVKAAKAASSDGKLTPDEKKQIKENAIASLKSHLGMKGLSELAVVLGLESAAVESLLSSKVEAAVHDLRSSTPVAAPAERGGKSSPLVPAPAV